MKKGGYGWGVLVLSLVLLVPAGWSEPPVFANTPEGFWVRAGSHSVYLQEFSPYPFLLNAALLGGVSYVNRLSLDAYRYLPQGKWLSQTIPLWLGRLGTAVGMGGSAWYLSTFLDQYGWWSGSIRNQAVEVDLAGVSARLVMAVEQQDMGTVFAFIPNPLIDPVSLSSGLDPVTCSLLSIHREMIDQKLGRLNVIPFHDRRGAGVRVGWRDASHTWHWLHLGVRFHSERGGVWLELPERRRDSEVISLFQPEVLNTILAVLKTGRATALVNDIQLLPLELDWTKDGYWTVELAGGDGAVFLEGVNDFSGIKKLRLFQVGGNNSDGTLYRIPRSWTSLAQLMMNAGWLASGYHPDLGIKKTALWGKVRPRLKDLESGKLISAGLTAPVIRKRMGLPISDVAVEYEYDLKNQNRIDLSYDLYQYIAKTSPSKKWQFEITGTDGRKVWVANSELGWRSGPSKSIYMAQHQFNGLQIEPGSGSTVSIMPVELEPVGQFELAVKEGPYKNLEQLADILTQSIVDNYPTLREGEHLQIDTSKGEHFEFEVKRGKLKNKKHEPAGAVYTLGSEPDLIVEYPDFWPADTLWDSGVVPGKPAAPNKGFVLKTGKPAEAVSKAEVAAKMNQAAKKVNNEDVRKEAAKTKFKVFSGKGYTTGRR
ncbi:hypothetical protein [Sansalvadorimonas verongulae]|uniref:hypothetical protein n=1 Tax=Sansalvadorimonas verongulae TaxID=2172824 RepID=UPI0012BC914B|nr:hypothetical protein [Sansalvadorimonas verongulae]MTI12346.1 hypothetical protein [Sansalvadorimonas verongulae]